MKKIKLLAILPILTLCVSLFSGFVFSSLQKDETVQSKAASVSVTSTQTQELGKTQDLTTSIYNIPDKKDYNPRTSGTTQVHPLGGKYANITLDILSEDGHLVRGENKNEINAFGFVAGSNLDSIDSKVVEINLNYAYNTTFNINSTNWSVYKDTWQVVTSSTGESIRPGPVDTGALIIQKSYDGSTWEWTNPITNGTATNVHTTKFTTQYTPSAYYGANNKFPIFTPSGADLARGIYIRVMFAYELKYVGYPEGLTYYPYMITQYRNILEETTFYICNSSGEVVFTNYYFSSGEAQDDDFSSIIRMAGSIKNGHGSNDGFRLNTLGNKSYKIWYGKDGSSMTTQVYDGQYFWELGRYDFKIQTALGDIKYKTLYINEQGVQRNVTTYFGDGLITKDSKRVFSTADPVPVYVAGATWWQTKSVNTNHMPLVGRITNEDTGDVIIVGEDNTENRQAFSGLLTSPGKYRAEFVNNVDYFTNGHSGDCYRFVFEFILVEEGNVPMTNEELLKNNIGFSDFASAYYGVSIKSAGNGYVTTVFYDYAKAHTYAYDYLKSLVEVNNGEYTFKGETYQTQYDVLGAVWGEAESIIEKKYFDASNPSSYLTIEYATENILSKELNYDIVVLGEAQSSYNLRVGGAYLNSKKYSYLNENGTITSGVNPVRFIQVAGYETASIKLVHEASNLFYAIEYGAPVQDVLTAKNAPSGKYKVVEQNIHGKAEYYATYIKPGDNTTTLTASRLWNGTATEHSLSILDAETPFTANSFIIRSATNSLDPYGIVKVTKQGGVTQIYQLDEVKDIIIDQEGNYTIQCVDRFGNTINYYVNIFTAQQVYTLSLVNNGAEVFKETAFGGQQFTLPTPTNADSNFEFIGWANAQGTIFKGSYTFNDNSDVVLTAVWNYIQTTIDIFDGVKIKTELVKAGEKLILPYPSKAGFILYGFAHSQENGTLKIYLGQINSVPNVQTMRLDALWVDYDITYTAQTPEREGMIFVGWLYEIDALSGYIIDGSDVEEGMTVYSVWKTDPNAEEDSGGVIAGTTTSSIGTVMPILLNLAKGLISVAGAAAILFLLAFGLRKLKKIQLVQRKAKAINAPVFAAVETVAVVDKSKKVSKHAPLLRFKFKKSFGIACIAFLLVGVMSFTAGYKLIFEVKRKIEIDNMAASLQKNFEDTRNMELALTNEKQTAHEQYLTQTTLAFNNPPTKVASLLSEDTTEEQGDELEISKENAFLYSLVFIDLMTFGYDVFPATAIKSNGDTVKGFGYTGYDEAYENNDDGRISFGAGFAALLGEQEITEADLDEGVEIKPIIDEESGETEDGFSFLLTFENRYGPSHYIAFEQYIRYSVKDFRIVINSTAVADDPSLFDQWGGEVGYLFSYDLGRAVYDPDIGKCFTPKAYSITDAVDYAFTQDMYRDFVAEQDYNGMTVDTASLLYISKEAIMDFVYVHNQEEEFLGLSTEQLFYVEANLENTTFYYIDGNGEIQVLPLPKDPANKASIWQRLAAAFISIAVIAVAIVVCVAVPALAAAAPFILGAAIGMGVELFMQVTIGGNSFSDVNWAKVAVSGIAGALSAIPGLGWAGAGLVMGGSQAVMTALDGGSLLDCVIAFGIGFATGVVIHFATKALSNVSSKIMAKIKGGVAFVDDYVDDAMRAADDYVDDAARNIKSIRGQAVKTAWKQEQELVKLTGKGTIDWTPMELDELLRTGKVSGYVGHHINSVKAFPNLAGDPNNIRFVLASKHLGVHGGNFRLKTDGALYDRIGDILKALGG